MATWQQVLDEQQGVATRAQLVAAGLSRRRLPALVAAGGLTRVGRGLYRDRPSPVRGEHLVSGGWCDEGYAAEVRQVLLGLGEGACAARRTAAVLWRFDLLVEPDGVEADVPHGRRTSRPGARQSRRPCTTAVGPVPGCRAIAVTSAVDTVLDCAVELPLIEAVVIADSALRSRACTPRQLRRAASARRGKVGAGRIWKVLRWCDPRGESVLESALRVVLCQAGLLPAQTQYELPARSRLDFAWPEHRLAVEADGRRWHDPQDRRDADRRRDNTAARLHGGCSASPGLRSCTTRSRWWPACGKRWRPTPRAPAASRLVQLWLARSQWHPPSHHRQPGRRQARGGTTHSRGRRPRWRRPPDSAKPRARRTGGGASRSERKS